LAFFEGAAAAQNGFVLEAVFAFRLTRGATDALRKQLFLYDVHVLAHTEHLRPHLFHLLHARLNLLPQSVPCFKNPSCLSL